MVEFKPYDTPGRESDPNCLELHVYPRPTDPATLLATLSWVRHGHEHLNLKHLLQGEPRDVEEARALARDHADAHGLPTVYERVP